ncbi:sugar phosphate nucleotidyltransferase [Chloroflexota bacterium]
MKAVILVGGKATRLLPLTHNTPKAIVPILNRPFLEYAIHHLSQHNVNEIVLAQGHLARPIENQLGDGTQFGIRISYVVESTPLGTAGAIKNAEKHLNETLLVLNGDIITDLDITSMVDFHHEKRAKVTIAITPVDDPTSYGLVETEADNRILSFLEKPDKNEVNTNMINAGTYVMEPEVVASIPPQTNFSFERQVFPQLLSQGESIYAYSTPSYWIDMGTPGKYLQLHRDLLSGKCRTYRTITDKEVIIGKNSNVHPTAQIEGPVIIGSNCSIGERVKLIGPVVIGDGCTILEDSIIKDCVIWRNVNLGPRVNLKNSILADNCCFNSDSIGIEAVIGDNVTVTSNCKIEPGSKIEPGTTVNTTD